MQSKAKLADWVYEKEGLERSVAKDQMDVTVARVWGPRLDGEEGTLGFPLERLLVLAVLTVAVCMKRQAPSGAAGPRGASPGQTAHYRHLKSANRSAWLFQSAWSCAARIQLSQPL